jgi:hypothetical protein
MGLHSKNNAAEARLDAIKDIHEQSLITDCIVETENFVEAEILYNSLKKDDKNAD